MAFRQYLLPDFLDAVYRPARRGECRRDRNWRFGSMTVPPLDPEELRSVSVDVMLANPDVDHPYLPARLRCATILSAAVRHDQPTPHRVTVRVPWPSELPAPSTVRIPPGAISRQRRYNVSMPYPPDPGPFSRKSIFALALVLALRERGIVIERDTSNPKQTGRRVDLRLAEGGEGRGRPG
ncbi:hypothetical protein [Methanopyrus sp.]